MAGPHDETRDDLEPPPERETLEGPKFELRPTPLTRRSTDKVEALVAQRATVSGGGQRHPHDEPMPEAIGGYQILRELAHGGMGIVYLAESPELERRVALKVLRGGNFGSAQARERFQIEARVVARLRHPNIVGIHEIGVDEGRHFLVMDLIDGESLRDRLQRGPMECRPAAEIAKVVAETLYYAHGRAILHRDIKPGNILLPLEGDPVLTDFGLAKDVDELERSPTISGQAIGTPAYMAPEQARGDTDHTDRRSDVYSLGATLYEMLTGEPPFDGKTVLEVLQKVTSDEVVKPSRLRPEIDPDLETIVLTCLEKEPRRRYDTAKALAEDLAHYLADESITARRPGPYDLSRRWLRRHRRVAAAIAGTLLVALVLVVIEANLFVRRLRQDHEASAEALEEVERERDAALKELHQLRGGAPDAPPTAARARQLVARAQAESAAGQHGAALVAYREAFRQAPELRAAHGIEAALAAARSAPGDAALADEAAAWLGEALAALRPAGPGLDDPDARQAAARLRELEAFAPWRERAAFAALWAE